MVIYYLSRGGRGRRLDEFDFSHDPFDGTMLDRVNVYTFVQLVGVRTHFFVLTFAFHLVVVRLNEFQTGRQTAFGAYISFGQLLQQV